MNAKLVTYSPKNRYTLNVGTVLHSTNTYLYILTSQCSVVYASSILLSFTFLLPISTPLVRSNPNGEEKSV